MVFTPGFGPELGGQEAPAQIDEGGVEEGDQDLDEVGTTSRQKRGVMSVARFKRIAQLVWNKDEGIVNDEICHNITLLIKNMDSTLTASNQSDGKDKYCASAVAVALLI